MTELKLIKSENFGTTQADIYSNGNEMFMTANQLGECLEYSNPAVAISKLLSKNKYLKNSEFSVVTKLVSTDGKQYNTRIFNEDGIYEITMLSKTSKAMEFRQWIRKVLKSIRQNGGYITNQENSTPEQILANAILVANNVIENQKKQLEEQKPKVEYFNIVADSKDNIDIGSFAKILKDKNINLGRNKLFDWFRNHQVFMKNSTLPYQTYIDRNYFKVIQTAKGDKLYLKTLITPKGNIYFTEKIMKEFKGE